MAWSRVPRASRSLAWAEKDMARWAAWAASRSRRAVSSGTRLCSVSHLAVFSVAIPSSAASTSAAAAVGARPSTEPGPCSASQAARRPAMVVDLPVPDGPTRTSRARPEVATFSTARAWSVLKPYSRPGSRPWQARATVAVLTAGAERLRPASSSLASASKRAGVVYSARLSGRRRDEPSERR